MPNLWMNCPKCGQEDDGKANFCWACGERLPKREKTSDQPRNEPGRSELRRMGLLLLFVLTLLTGGLFVPIWFLVQRPGLNSLRSEKKLGLTAAIVALALLSIAVILSVYGSLPLLSGRIDMTAAVYGLAANAIELLAWVLLLWQSLGVRGILDEHLNRRLGQNVHLSIPLTLLLLVLYLQFKINRIPELADVSHVPEQAD